MSGILLELPISQSQSKRSTKLSHIRLYMRLYKMGVRKKALFLLRCPISSLSKDRLRQLSPAATRSPPFTCLWQRSARSPKASALLCSQAAAKYNLLDKQKSPDTTKAVSGLLVRMTGFEPAASCSQSKRSTKLSHIRK